MGNLTCSWYPLSQATTAAESKLGTQAKLSPSPPHARLEGGAMGSVVVTVPILSAIVAAIVSLSIVFLGRRSETIKQLQSLRIAAYVDFIRSVSGLAVVGREPVQSKEHLLKEWELRMLLADAKSRIAIYGSQIVASSLAEFLRDGNVLNSPERARAFTAVCQKMRGDTRPKLGHITDKDMHYLLFELDIS